jgi:hypothetical protein
MRTTTEFGFAGAKSAPASPSREKVPRNVVNDILLRLTAR